MYLIKRERYLKHTRNVIDWTSVFRNKSGDTADIKNILNDNEERGRSTCILLRE